jgi:hypothetical protein
MMPPAPPPGSADHGQAGRRGRRRWGAHARAPSGDVMLQAANRLSTAWSCTSAGCGRWVVHYDRDAILAAIDGPAMAGLADELLGPHKGTDRSPTWRCPSPEHTGQTGRTPPVSIFADRIGEQRWYCHGCGIGGTAIDLVVQVRGVGIGAALGQLARRTGAPPLAPGQEPTRRVAPERAHRASAERPAKPSPALDRYVAECAETLWSPCGRAVLRWLTETRCLPEEVLRANRIGVDLGPRRQPRPDGVPKVRRAVVLPVQISGAACYVQLRTLSADRNFPKYLNSRESLGPNPRLGLFHPPQPATRPEWLITEGIFDALAATTAGCRAAAVLGAAYPDRSIALRLSRLLGPLVIAFDVDPAGHSGAHRLTTLLAAHRREAAVLTLPSGTDLNDRAISSGDWPVELAARVDHATHQLRHLPPALVHGLA